MRHSKKLTYEIPNSVAINPKVSYSVVYLKSVDRDGALGYCDDDKKEIQLKLGMPKKTTFSVFIHEMLHAIEMENGIYVPHQAILDFEEGIVELLELNPKLFEWTRGRK